MKGEQGGTARRGGWNGCLVYLSILQCGVQGTDRFLGRFNLD